MPGPPQPRHTDTPARSIPPSPSRLQQAKSGSYPCWPFRAPHQMSKRGSGAGSAPGCASRGLKVGLEWLGGAYSLAIKWLSPGYIHHPYTIRTPSVHDMYTICTRYVHDMYTICTRYVQDMYKIRTPCQCAMPWLAPRVRLASNMVGPLVEGHLARKDNGAREEKPTGRLGLQLNPRCLAELNHISGPGAGPVSGLCFAVFDSG
jgi:hypothetical protein